MSTNMSGMRATGASHESNEVSTGCWWKISSGSRLTGPERPKPLPSHRYVSAFSSTNGTIVAPLCPIASFSGSPRAARGRRGGENTRRLDPNRLRDPSADVQPLGGRSATPADVGSGW